MSKFNLKTYQKINGDEHITQRLKEQHEDAPEVITEKQLDDNRVDEKEVIMEKLLEKVRTGSADKVTEKNLDDSKGLFAPLRNSETHTGDINKLEEKRLAGEKNEEEKYESASEIPNGLRWWEHLKPIKSSKSYQTIKTAAKGREKIQGLDKWTGEEAFKNLGELESEGMLPEEGVLPDNPVRTELPVSEDSPNLAETAPEADRTITILKSKETQSPMASMYFKLGYDPSSFEDDQDAKEEALDIILRARPNLEDKISAEDFSIDRDGNLILRLIGEEYFAPLKEETDEFFSNLESEEVDMGGTPVTVGRIKLSPEAIALAENDKEEFDTALSDWVLEQDPSLSKMLGSTLVSDHIDMSNLKSGEVTFAISETSTGDFPVTEATPEGDVNESPDDTNIDDFDVTEDDAFEPYDETPPIADEEPSTLAFTDFPIVTAQAKDTVIKKN